MLVKSNNDSVSVTHISADVFTFARNTCPK